MNWTTDSWTLQENVVLVAEQAPALAAEFARNFDELWSTRDVDAQRPRGPAAARRGRPRGARLVHARPRRGALAPDRQGDRKARERVRIASPVITAGPVLGTLAEVTAEQQGGPSRRGRPDADGPGGLPVADERPLGVEDPDPRVGARHGDFKGKLSTQWTPETPHDFMHAKVTVADDTVFVGSFNLSRSGEMNAENVLEIARRRAGRPARRLHRRGPRALRAYARA